MMLTMVVFGGVILGCSRWRSCTRRGGCVEDDEKVKGVEIRKQAAYY